MELNTLSYVLGAENTIEAGEEYYFGQLWDGNGDGEELLDSGAIAVYQDGEEYIVDFEISESAEDILQTRVKVTGINQRAGYDDEVYSYGLFRWRLLHRRI